MPTRAVVIHGVMTWEDSGPPGIWGGGNVPMPTPPIHIPPPSSNPPGIWGGGNQPFPTPPINLPPSGSPPGTWGGAGQPFPTPPINIPGNPPGIWGGAGQPFPTPPINIPGQPPGIWGGGNQPFPTPPINIPGPGQPTHPIYNPPGIWGGGNVPMPSPPIYLPPEISLPPGGTPIPPAANVPIDGKLVFVPGYGWMFIPDGASTGTGEDVPHVDNTLPGDLPIEAEDNGGKRGRK